MSALGGKSALGYQLGGKSALGDQLGEKSAVSSWQNFSHCVFCGEIRKQYIHILDILDNPPFISCVLCVLSI